MVGVVKFDRVKEEDVGFRGGSELLKIRLLAVDALALNNKEEIEGVTHQPGHASILPQQCNLGFLRVLEHSFNINASSPFRMSLILFQQSQSTRSYNSKMMSSSVFPALT